MSPEALVSSIAAIGFGIQQFLQVVADPIISVILGVMKNRPSANTGSPLLHPEGAALLPWGISDVDAKKAMLGLVSFTLGILIALTVKDIRVLKVANIATDQSKLLLFWDVFITALTISAGTEGMNSGVKLIQYLKDAVKKKTPASVAQQSPVPQAPSKPVSSDEFFAEFENPDRMDSDTAERATAVKSRAKEEGYEA